MKLKLLLSVVFACTLLTTSYAQINKGSIWLGSTFTYGQIKNKPGSFDTEQRSIAITPAFGVAVKENLVVGIFGTYYDSHIEIKDPYDLKQKSYGGGVFVRRYVPLFSRFYIFGEGRLDYNTYKTTNTQNWGTGGTYSSKMEGWSTGLRLTPGISYGITQNLQLEAGFSNLFNIWYSDTKLTGNLYSEQKSKYFGAGANLENLSAFSIGFRFLINKKA